MLERKQVIHTTTSPNLTRSWGEFIKLAPKIAMRVPPAAGPLLGTTSNTDGGGGGVAIIGTQ